MPSASAERFVYLIKIYLGHPEVTRRQCTNIFRGRRYPVANDCSVYHKSTITTTGWKIKPDSSKLKYGTNYLMTARETAGIGWLGTLSPLWRLTRTDCTHILQQFFRRSSCCLGAGTWACATFLISLPALFSVTKQHRKDCRTARNGNSQQNAEAQHNMSAHLQIHQIWRTGIRLVPAPLNPETSRIW